MLVVLLVSSLLVLDVIYFYSTIFKGFYCFIVIEKQGVNWCCRL